MKNYWIGLAAAATLLGCTPKRNNGPALLPTDTFETTLDGKAVKLYTLQNDAGFAVQITNYGARVVTLFAPDKNGIPGDVAMGFGSIREFTEKRESFFGALIGRYGNRIGKAAFPLNGKTYALDANDHGNMLHGGFKGYYNQVWTVAEHNHEMLELKYLSPDGEGGFPGNLETTVVYRITRDNELKIEYFAQTDQPTVVNLTNHTYFNLKGESSIENHEIQIVADYFTPVDSLLIPTGELRAVDQTPMDLRTPVAIGAGANAPYEQLAYGKGYDHNWVLRKDSAQTLTLAAKVFEPESGRIMEVFTNEPGIQFYGGNFMDGQDTGKYGKPLVYRGAFCLETQHFPDSPNKPEFPSTLLLPGEHYYSVCVYKFSVQH